MDKQVGEWINKQVDRKVDKQVGTGLLVSWQVGPRWRIIWKKQPRKNNNKSKVKAGEKTRGKNFVKGQHQKV